MWGLDGCGNSSPTEKAGNTLKVIDALSRRHGGIIQGLITDNGATYPRDVDLSGVKILVRGGGRDYQALSNAKGEFSLHVPPGRYFVMPSQAGHKFETSLFSYEVPEDILMVNGGGAQILFDRK